jgi:transcriptional regulator GlxA family with amidase domain
MQFSNIQLKRGSRFVQSDDVLFTAGGLTSGIDLTLHIVEKFYGREAADRTAAAYTSIDIQAAATKEKQLSHVK